jgi:hypothetical protein
MKINNIRLVIFTFIFLSNTAFTQLSKNSSLIGFRTDGVYSEYYVKSESKWIAFYQIRFEPYYMFFIKENWGVGVMGEMEFLGGRNMEDNAFPETKNTYGVGPISRFYYPIQIDRGFFRRMKFYSEVSLTFTNYYQTKETFAYASNGNLKFSILRLRPVGVSFKLFKGLNLELSPAIFKYFPGRWRVGMNFGFEYHFGKNNSE